jgi:hypothetical protein
MGQPGNYSLELPRRCIALLRELHPLVKKVRQPDRPDLGPLTTTFILSMSMPIISVPIERIAVARGSEYERFVSDPIEDAALKAIDEALGGGEIGKAPFFADGDWQFVRLKRRTLNIAEGLPPEVLKELGDPDAQSEARKMPGCQWYATLRNALAHGGIMYLDEFGRTSYGGPVSMYAFVSGRYDSDSCERPKPLNGVNILRIRQQAYLNFLERWVQWLSAVRIVQMVA